MATPTFLVQTVNATVIQNTAQVLNLGIVKDVAGTPIDIDTGYTALTKATFSAAKDKYAPVTLAGTYTYGTDGSLLLTLTKTEANALPVGRWNFTTILSDDAFTTSNLHGNGAVTVVSNPSWT